MRTGLKLWSTNDFFIEEAQSLFDKGIFDYIELFTVPDSEEFIGCWKNSGIPFVLHAPHSLAGLNPADKKTRSENLKMFALAEEYRKALNPEFIIFHPGLDGTADEAVSQFSSAFDKFEEIKKIAVLENKPAIGINGEKCVGSLPDEIKFITGSVNIDFCLDIGHCICAANSMRIPPFSLIREFLELDPVLFHLSDGDFSSETDAHLNYGEGTYPIREILKMLPDNPTVTVETEKKSFSSLNSFVRDAEFLKNLNI
jgi:sugar phosphate isomerase/epimerase